MWWHGRPKETDKKESVMLLDEKTAIKFLRCPDSRLVELAVSLANLSWKEAKAIDLCGRQAMTQEQAAEVAECSVDTMQRWYRAGIKKLCKAWAGVWWIVKLSESC